MTTDRAMKLIKKYIKKWEYMVTHWGWKFNVNYCECYDDMPTEASEHTDAITFMIWNYLEGSIFFNLKRMARHDEEDIESVVIHELSHFLLAPVQTDADNLELAVTMVARTINGLR